MKPSRKNVAISIDGPGFCGLCGVNVGGESAGAGGNGQNDLAANSIRQVFNNWVFS